MSKETTADISPERFANMTEEEKSLLPPAYPFLTFPLNVPGTVVDLRDKGQWPIVVVTANIGVEAQPFGQEGATTWVLPYEGELSVFQEEPTVEVTMEAPFFAVLPGEFALQAYDETVSVLLITMEGYEGYRQFGGPLEAKGRLRYIDRSSDTLLHGPPIKGEPCLNHLHLPGGVDQTAHTHPSERIGIITAGHGFCMTEAGKTELLPGMAWHIPTGMLHSFHTLPGESLDVVAWHPDSIHGPSDDDHPMLSRSYVEGVSAAKIDAIKTKGEIEE